MIDWVVLDQFHRLKLHGSRFFCINHKMGNQAKL